jgi:hypothetical protein
MTELSPINPAQPKAPGSQLAPSLAVPAYQVPAVIIEALRLDRRGQWEYDDALAGLSRTRAAGLPDDAILEASVQAIAALAPCPTQRLMDRLTMLGMSTMQGKDPAQIKAWLHETARLLDDITEEDLFEAIDECVKEPGRIFTPTVGEIRAKALPAKQKREREAARLRRVAMLIEDGVEPPPPPAPFQWPPAERRWDDSMRCSPEAAAKILKEECPHMRTDRQEALKAKLEPPRKPTRADYIAMGVDPAILDRKPSDEGGMPV